jgi:hypothetical protein
MRRDEDDECSLLLTELDLEADDVAVLDLALSKRELRLHQLDHARFDFLQQKISATEHTIQCLSRAHLVELEWGSRPAHHCVD